MVSSNSAHSSLTFDKGKGKFIVNVNLSPDQYARIAQHQVIADIDSVKFDKDSGKFNVPLYMSPAEYGDFLQDKMLPKK